MNKKGIAPLVSTIILLIFATGLGIVVMNWGNAVEIEQHDGCGAELQLVTVEGIPQACYSENKLRLTVENTGLSMIEGVKLAVIDEAGVLNQEFPTRIQFVEVREIELSADRALANVQKIKLTPKTDVYCTTGALEIDTVEVCT